MKLNRIIIPKSLRKEMLNIIHEGHMGMSRCISFARTAVYWPQISNDINNIVSNCDFCQEHRNNIAKEPMLPHEIIDLPWYKLGMDIFDYDRQKFLLLVDYFSKYVELADLTKDSTAGNVIKHMKSSFARHGIPKQVVADNGPPFNSKEMQQFSKEWNFDLVNSSPYLSNSNGMAERSIQTIKKMLKKCNASKTDPYIGLLNLRSTPNSLGTSPSQALMSRMLRTKLPMSNANLKPKLVSTDEYRNKINRQQVEMKNYYDRHTKTSNINPNAPIYFKKDPKGLWHKGKIVENRVEPRSFNVSDSYGKIYRRSSRHIMQPKTNEQEKSPKSLIVSPHKDNQLIGGNSNIDNHNKMAGNDLIKDIQTESDSPIEIRLNNPDNNQGDVQANDDNTYRTRFGRSVKPRVKYL